VYVRARVRVIYMNAIYTNCNINEFANKILFINLLVQSNFIVILVKLDLFKIQYY